ncbi:MAG: two-component regulator propeller domain-containing protein [Crocinitomicaceae bacterium]
MKILFLLIVSLLAIAGQSQSMLEKEVPNAETIELYKRIWDIFQDSKGNYWFGSNGKGLYFYDGQNLKQITMEDGLISNHIRSIQEDNKGNIYIETPSGISHFNGSQFKTLEVIKSANNHWELEPNDLWFNCNGNANHVYRFDGKNLYELQLPKQDIKNELNINEENIRYSPYTVFGIDKDKAGNIWFGTVIAGAFRYDGQSFLWVGDKELSRLPSGREPGVRSILEDNNGHIWLSNFISKYAITDDSIVQYQKIKITGISEKTVKNNILYFNSGLKDEDGNLWMTTYGGTVWKYDGKKLSNFKINNGKENVLLISIYQDNSGTLWLGTDNDGAYKHNGNSFEKFEIDK